MHGARHCFSWEKEVFPVIFSLTIPRFLGKSKSRLNTSLGNIKSCCKTEFSIYGFHYTQNFYLRLVTNGIHLLNLKHYQEEVHAKIGKEV